MTAGRTPSTARCDSSAARCYLVTGAAGFIASKVCEFLLAEGHTVVGVDNLNDYYDVRLKDYRLTQLLGGSYGLLGSDPRRSIFADNKEPLTNNCFEFRVLDIENLAALEEVFKAHKFDAIFNLAARAGVRASLENPGLYHRTNVVGEENVLKCQVKYGVKKHVVASSSSVYAGCPIPFVEDAVLGKMQSPYAETKRRAELLALDYHQRHGLDVSVLRYFTVFGPAGRPDMAPFRFIKWIAEGTPITLYGDGTQARDFTYVDDIARGTILAAKPLSPVRRASLAQGDLPSKSEDGGRMADGGRQTDPKSQTQDPRPECGTPGFHIFNLGGGNNPITITAVIQLIEKELNEQSAKSIAHSGSEPLALGPSLHVAFKAKIAAQPASEADMKETWADITKAGRLLGWSPQVTPEDGFRRTVDWYFANRDWLREIKV